MNLKIVGEDLIEKGAITQMQSAMEIPSAVRGALMPDAHLGYCLPIGGVLACKDAVIPYGVGVDIGCRMRLSITDASAFVVTRMQENDNIGMGAWDDALRKGTKFGLTCEYPRSGRQQHDIMDDGRWRDTDFLHEQKGNAWKQLGTSGGGNNFVEWGVVVLREHYAGLNPGYYVGLLSHSGSRGTGHKVCMKYTKIAKQLRGKEWSERAWLDMESEAGQEYWLSMNLMLDYAQANHEVIHQNVLKRMGLHEIGCIENHHNFASIEDGLVVHRKGATPAHKGIYGVVPGTMASPTYIIRGTGKKETMDSCSHGAGRSMPRGEAKRTLKWDDHQALLDEKGVRVLGAQVDELPAVYKDIDAVMEAQWDQFAPQGHFYPHIVMMSPRGRGED